MIKYLVQIKSHEEEYSDLKSKEEIIEMINLSDCYDEIYKVYNISKFGEIEELKIYGPWHNPDKPLYIKLTDKIGNILIEGFGAEH